MMARRKRLIRELANLAPRKVIASWAYLADADGYRVTDRNGTTCKISGQEVRNAR